MDIDAPYEPPKKPGPPKGTRYGGRQKGTPNKKRDEFHHALIEAAKEVLGDPDFDLQKEMWRQYSKLTDADAKLSAVFKVMEFIYPKKKAVEVTGEDGGPVQVDVVDAARRFDKIASA